MMTKPKRSINELELELFIVNEVIRRLDETRMPMDEALRVIERVRYRLTELKLEYNV